MWSFWVWLRSVDDVDDDFDDDDDYDIDDGHYQLKQQQNDQHEHGRFLSVFFFISFFAAFDFDLPGLPSCSSLLTFFPFF